MQSIKRGIVVITGTFIIAFCYGSHSCCYIWSLSFLLRNLMDENIKDFMHQFEIFKHEIERSIDGIKIWILGGLSAGFFAILLVSATVLIPTYLQSLGG